MQKLFLRVIKKYVVLFFLLFCITWNTSGEEKSIAFFVTTDLHGNIESSNAGILRLATVLKREITSAGGLGKSIIIDCGDFSQGSVEASLVNGKIIFEFLSCLHYDVIVPGNHDFDYGLDKLEANQKEISSKILCGNLLLSEGKNPFKSWKIINKNGLKIAVIGLTYPGIEGIDKVNNLSYKTGSIANAIRKILAETVSEKPDLIVLVIHGGLYNSGWSLKNILRKFPEIDIVFAGHTHEEIPGKLLYNHTYFIQTGSHAEYLGEIVVKISDGKKKISSRLITVSGAEVDSDLAGKFKSSLDNLRIGKEKKVAYLKNRITLSQLAMDSMSKRTKADAVIFGLSEFSRPMKGEIKYKDVFNAAPYEDAIATMMVSKDELKIILQELYSYMKKKKKYKNLLYAGFSIEKAQGKIVDLKFDKNNLDKEKILLAFSSYYVEYPGNKFPEIRKIARNDKSKYNSTNISIRDALLDYLVLLLPPAAQK